MLKAPLLVKRRLGNGDVEGVGRLVENAGGVYFQYDESYIAYHQRSLSPFTLALNRDIQKAPRVPHQGLHGLFADSLPDGWGLYLMDRVFRRHGYNPRAITALERLAFTGRRGQGALFYEPELEFGMADAFADIELIALGREAVEEFEGGESHLIEHLLRAGGSGGARPKLNVTRRDNGTYTTNTGEAGEKLIIKLTSDTFSLGHEESLVEYTFMTLARAAGIDVPSFALIDAGEGHRWLEQTRFDCIGASGRVHMLSAAGMFDASFREPSLDYVDLIKATGWFCGTHEARKLVRRALFNYLMVNQDDHGKNLAYLMDDDDTWRLSPFFDLVYTPSPYGEHMTAFQGHGAKITADAMALMAGYAGLSSAREIIKIADDIYSEVKNFQTEARNTGVSQNLCSQIQKDIEKKWRQLNTTTV